MVCGCSKAYRMKMETDNANFHLQGMYFYDALISGLSTLAKGNHKKYVEKPFNVLPPTKSDKKKEREDADKEIDRFFDYLSRHYKGEEE